ncbi:HugZ family protein [Roseomonas sp. CCTCC AB2023176]|uniref:HugZ family pyridoxamine 5'-phosphate oxidase n=1 Tax=Roseomonas sp. CCTCC AB2023176 TaxID=3342640 RepID=UPI0035DCF533
MTETAPDHGLTARHLLRSAGAATLATVMEGGAPFVALVTPAVAPDGTILLWLSTLSAHTRHLTAEARCALLAAGPAADANPQTAPRVSVTGIAEQVDDPALKARWLGRHPYAALYADFGDFSLWRITPGGGLLVGGFAAAHRLRAADLAPPAEAVAALAEAEADVLAHVNEDHADALAAIARHLGGGEGAWRMANLSPDGCDLVRAEEEVRFMPFRQPARTAGEVRDALVTAVRAARAAAA